MMKRTLSAQELGFTRADGRTRDRLLVASRRWIDLESILKDIRHAYRIGQEAFRMTYICLRGGDDLTFFEQELRKRHSQIVVSRMGCFSKETLVVELEFTVEESAPS